MLLCSISVVIAYLLGSLSSAIIASKLLRLPDPRIQGSGNAGATNILRSGKKKLAVYVLSGDVLKGFVAVLIARALQVHHVGLAFVALFVVIGHVFPIFFNFHGGKGVATSAGALFVLSPWTSLFLIVVWCLTAFYWRYASLASIVTSIAALLFLLIGGQTHYLFPVSLIAVLIVYKHRDNIARLQKGTESKITL